MKNRGNRRHCYAKDSKIYNQFDKGNKAKFICIHATININTFIP